MIDFPKKVRRQNGSVFVLLINVIFLLIVFFLVAGRIEKPDFYPVNIPASASLNQKTEPQAYITISPDGEMIANDKFVSENELKNVLAQVFAEKPGQEISIKADSSLEAKKLIHVINLVKISGGKNISLITKNYERP